MRINEPGSTSQARMPKLEKGDVVGTFQSTADKGPLVHGPSPIEDLKVRKVMYSSNSAGSAVHMLERLSSERGDENLALVRTATDPAKLFGAGVEYHVVRLNFNPDESHASDVHLSRDAATGVNILALGDSQSLMATSLSYADDNPFHVF